ncbi:Cupredoxin [Trichophaea hybrida]|nr:Cupredoxin [Trichophaea hybrida]
MKLTSTISLLSAAGTAWATNYYQPPAPQGYNDVMNKDMPMPMHTTAAVQYVSGGMPPDYVMTDSPTQTAAAAAVTHTVTVGGAGLAFNPNEIVAAVGDTVHFVMLAKNHSVTQSSFLKPCVRLPTGKDSGFLPNPSNDTVAAPTFSITVQATDPTWWYCKQRLPKPHCGTGMVFAINPTAEKSFQKFQAMAIAQNGTGAAPPPPPPVGTGGAGGGAAVTLTVDNSGLPPPEATATAAPPAQTVIAPGWNNRGNPAVCNCACFCGVAAFPAGDGVGAYGGYSGSLPAPWG